MHRSRISTLLIDTPSEHVQAGTAFWTSALGVGSHHPPGEDQFTTLHEPIPGLVTAVQTINGPARYHLDMETDDVAAEVARLQSHGAVEQTTWQGCHTLQVPGGHLLCVIPVHSPIDEFNQAAHLWP